MENINKVITIEVKIWLPLAGMERSVIEGGP